MLKCHDFINGEYYEDTFTGETMSIQEYYEGENEKELRRECQQYILIKKCESIIHNSYFYCDLFKWHYRLSENKPEDTIILSNNEYIKKEGKKYFYRSYKGEDYLFLEVTCNKLLSIDKIEEIYGFIICTIKGKGILYTKEQFIEKIK